MMVLVLVAMADASVSPVHAVAVVFQLFHFHEHGTCDSSTECSSRTVIRRAIA